MPFQTTKSTKLIVFQYKLSHRRLTTNTFLYKVLKLKENDKNYCTFCQSYKENLIPQHQLKKVLLHMFALKFDVVYSLCRSKGFSNVFRPTL